MRQIHQKMPPYALTAIQKAVKLASGADVPPSNVTIEVAVAGDASTVGSTSTSPESPSP